MSTAALYTVVPLKPVEGEGRPVLGCDLTSISPAPFGDLVRVCFDLDDLRASRETALGYGKLFLPVREGFRHFVLAESDCTFVVGLRPDDDRDDDVVICKFHSVRSFSLSHVVWHSHHAHGGKGRPSMGAAA